MNSYKVGKRKEQRIMYKTERLEAEISVEKYLDEYVNIQEFLECCKVCGNYEKKWSCPPYDFDVLEYWKQYSQLYLLGYKIIFDEEYLNKRFEKEELDHLTYEVLSKEKQRLAVELYGLEEQQPGSISLSAGSCNLCGDGMMNSKNCTRISLKDGENDKACGGAKENCAHYDKMRYSIESLGGNVGKTCSKLLEVDLEWSEEGRLPKHFVLVCGLLKEEDEKNRKDREKIKNLY